MNNHRKLREAPSERPADPAPSPSADRTGNSGEGAKETRTEHTKEES